MRRAALALLALSACAPALTGERGVVGDLDGEEFLRLRAGPGLGFAVVAGLPEGAAVRIGACELVGGTSWCEVSLATAPGLAGYAARPYLAAP